MLPQCGTEIKMSFFEKLKKGLTKTKDGLLKQIDGIFRSFVRVDEDMLEELEELLITADVGVGPTEKIIDALRERIRDDRISEPEDAKAALCDILRGEIGEGEPLCLDTKPAVVLIIGVNGVGKTTSIAKIAASLKSEGKRVILAAADTFPRLPSTSSVYGRSASVWISSAMRRAPTPQRSCSMPPLLQRSAERMF